MAVSMTEGLRAGGHLVIQLKDGVETHRMEFRREDYSTASWRFLIGNLPPKTRERLAGEVIESFSTPVDMTA